MDEKIVDKLIKYWEEKLGTKLYEDEVKAIKEFAYRMLDQLVEQRVKSAKEEKERSQRFKGLGIE